jgi:restriction system protein
MADQSLPRWKDLLWPALEAVKALGGSGTNQEIESKVADLAKLSEEQQAVPHGDGRVSEINYRLAWCRTYLKGVGYLTQSGRGIWAITDLGKTKTEADMATVQSLYRTTHREQRPVRPRKTRGAGEPSEEAGLEVDDQWKDGVLEILKGLTPERFEHLAKRILREAGFVQVEVTGRTGDEGIDGKGIYRPSLVSFPVFFQCKRYGKTVGASKVRDFRGAMAGRGDQGLLITTGSFTTEAKAEASRPGAPLIDLIDGEKLCDLLKEHGLGVKTKQVEVVEVEASFFEQF